MTITYQVANSTSTASLPIVTLGTSDDLDHMGSQVVGAKELQGGGGVITIYVGSDLAASGRGRGRLCGGQQGSQLRSSNLYYNFPNRLPLHISLINKQLAKGCNSTILNEA